MLMMKSLKRILNDMSYSNVSAGVIASIFGCTGPIVILMNVATDGGLSQGEMISWIFSVYVIGGLLGIYLALKYRIPISGAWSIPSAVFIGTLLQEYSFSSIIGAFIISSLLVLILGYSKLTSKILQWIPVPIIMAMVAGSMLNFALNIITSFEAIPIIASLSIIGYFLSVKNLTKFPPILGAIAFSIIGLFITRQFNVYDHTMVFMGPQLILPSFHLSPILSISVPVAILAIGVNNAQAIGVLIAQGYSAPIDHMTTTTGWASLVSAFFGGHGATIAGPKTAICASSSAGSDLSKRYIAAVVDGIIFVLFGLLSSYAIGLLTVLPVEMIQLIAGLAMLPVLMSFFQKAFSTEQYQAGAFIAFLISLSSFQLFNISAPFWALVFGSLIGVGMKKNFEKE